MRNKENMANNEKHGFRSFYDFLLSIGVIGVIYNGCLKDCLKSFLFSYASSQRDRELFQQSDFIR